MHAAWIRPGGPRIPDGTKAKRLGIDTFVWDATDPVIAETRMENGQTVYFFDDVRTWGFKPGITRDPTWTDATPAQLATLLDSDLKRLGTSDKTCLVVADIEAMWKRGASYVVDFLAAWRKLRPTRTTVWTTEPLQGGTVSDALAAAINADKNLLVAPQLYTDTMALMPEGAVLLEMGQNLERRNIARQRIVAYYDAAHLPAAWSGLAFDFATAT
jgi:hypothetical protein